MLTEQVKYLWEHEEVEILLFSLLFTLPEQYGCSQGLCVGTAPLCYTCGVWLCVGVSMQVRDVSQRPEILMGAVIVLCFSSVGVLQANSEERAVLPAVGLSSVLSVVQLLSVACGC